MQDDKRTPIIQGIAVTGAITAYFAAPVLDWLNPGFLALLGGALGFSAGTIWLELSTPSHSKWWLRFFALTFFLSLIGIVVLTTIGQLRYSRVSEQCEELERKMLLADDNSSRIAEVYQALNCKPFAPNLDQK
ncbi:hypothetical protein [Erythrobacter sp. A6_0]|uniref:hypothetical protein n=1 Tax=Erythrobacter sp. A6_0 TaxID=2821089 RepID=UPI001ADAADBE|nr:hypothetical protein [Erythrobacter sp. A6_0]MBO9510921.1 hypothetical protein [Erythrobacter sp. A6_0]